MNKHLRLKGYLNGDETISMEGLFGFGGPSDPKLKQILNNHNRTIGNKAWVTARLAAKAVANDRIIDAVSYNGKTYTDPVQALKQSGSMYASFLKNYRKRLDGYGEDIMDILMWGNQLLQQGQDPNLVGQRMVDELEKHPLPIDSAARYTEFFGNVAWNPGTGFATDASVVASATQLPPLTANQIVEATKIINDQTTWISKFQENQVMPGTRISDDQVYAQLGKSSSRSEIANLFGNDRVPRKQFDQLQKGINHWLNMHKVVLQWINTQLKDSVSTESINGDHFMGQHNRLSSYLTGEQTTISTEGLWDNLKEFFTGDHPDNIGPNGAPNPYRKKSAGETAKWLKKFNSQLQSTFGNKAWVTEHLSSTPVTDVELLRALSFNQKPIGKPIDVLNKAKSIVQPFVSTNTPKLNRYIDEVDTASQLLVGGIISGDIGDITINLQAGLTALENIKRPFPDSFNGPDYLGGQEYILYKGSHHGEWRTDSRYTAPKQPLPTLSVEDVVQAISAVCDSMAVISSMESAIDFPQEMMQQHQWEQLQKVNLELYNEAEVELIDRPSFQSMVLTSYLQAWRTTLLDVVKWVYLSCGGTQISTESIGGQVSMEGLWDDIKKLFDASAPDPRVKEKNGRKVYEFSWVPTFKQEIEKTYANLDWVKRHYHPRDVRAPKLAVELSYKRRLPETPLEVLTIAQDVALGHYKQANPALEAYDKSITQIEKEMGALFDKTEDEEKTIKEFAKRAKSLKRPFHKGMVGPEWLGGLKVMVVESRGLGYETVGVAPTKGYHVNGNTLAKLTPEQIVEAAKAMLVAVETIAKLKYPSAGSGCDDGVWEYLYGVDDEDSLEIAQEYTYFQAAPEEQSNYVSLYISEWSDVLYKVARWLHTQVTEEDVSLESLERSPMSLLARPKLPNKHNISLESNGPRLAKYFDDKPKAARSDQRAALFGTVESGWRAILEDKLECAVFNPVVANWDKEAQAQEELVKKTASALVFCITPKQTGFYSFVELTGAAIRTPERVFICFLNDDEGTTWPEKQQASIDATKTYLTNECGITVYETLDALAEAINAEVEPISANGSLKDTDNVPTPTPPEGGL